MEKVSTDALGKAATKLSETDPDVKGVSSATEPHTEMFNWGSGLRARAGRADRPNIDTAPMHAPRHELLLDMRAPCTMGTIPMTFRAIGHGATHTSTAAARATRERDSRDAPATSGLAGWPPRARHARERCPLGGCRELNVCPPSKASENSLPSRPRRRRESGPLPTWPTPTDGHPRPVGKLATFCVACHSPAALVLQLGERQSFLCLAFMACGSLLARGQRRADR